MDERLVYKSNALVEASYRLSVYEQRIILGCIAQVRRDEPLTDERLYTISAQQVAQDAGVSVGRAYQHLRAASGRLYRREVTLHDAPNGGGAAKVRLTRWVQEVVYQEAQGTVSLRFSRPILPYLTQLTEQFTRYALGDVAKLNSAYAIRLYELLCQWRTAGKREVSIDWLREAFQLEGRYPATKDLKRWVIQPAVDQINEHSPLWVCWDQRKSGRRITHFLFEFRRKESKSDSRVSSPSLLPAATYLPDDWVLPAEWREWAAEQGKAKRIRLSDADIEEMGEMFADHWRSEAGEEARKVDWLATWRNWVRRELQWKKERAGRFGGAGSQKPEGRVSAVRTANQMAEQRENEPEDLRAAVFGHRSRPEQ
ncbi:replication initiation protein [Thioalkalivibrio thiocyanoxidans]|uniref:replication initiation protein n=1 Tax=Thioalkalivibrio thiocyanoxidans TaxID=152475 RepID=UPI000378B087|nr:replication initiation protein [Thioalkalivibrio thiocyanoxidans]